MGKPPVVLYVRGADYTGDSEHAVVLEANTVFKFPLNILRGIIRHAPLVSGISLKL